MQSTPPRKISNVLKIIKLIIYPTYVFSEYNINPNDPNFSTTYPNFNGFFFKRSNGDTIWRGIEENLNRPYRRGSMFKSKICAYILVKRNYTKLTYFDYSNKNDEHPNLRITRI